MGGTGSGSGTKRPDHPTGALTRGIAKSYDKQRKHLKSLFSDKPDPSCHKDKRDRDFAAGITPEQLRDLRFQKKEYDALAEHRRRQISMEARDLQDLARSAANIAMQAMIDILENPEAADTAKIAAANLVFDRGYGKAAATMTITQTDTKPANLDDNALSEQITNELKEIRKLRGGEAEEAQSEERPISLREYN